MKFFYAVTLFCISVVVFFLAYIFVIPTPKLYVSDNVVIDLSADPSSTVLKQALKIAKVDNKKRFYYFDTNLDDKRNSAIFLYTMTSFVILFIIAVLFYSKPYMLFPLITALILTVTTCALLWIFTSTVPKEVYLDLQDLRYSYSSLREMEFVSLFLFLQVTIMIFGYTYKFPKRIV